MSAMIKTVNLTKKYGQQTAVDALNLDVAPGITFGLLGPNGAGKTTTLKLLAALLAPTSGQVFLNGELMNRNNQAAKKILGMVSQHISLQKEMTPVEVLKMHGMLHKMPSPVIRDKIGKLLAFAGLEKDAGKFVNQLSGGSKRKLMIIRAVMHEPRILFLDEPTVGLDANIRRSIWDLLKRLKNDGLTTILTTHYIEEAGSLCDIISMMSEGRIIARNSPQGFLNAGEPYAVEVFEGGATRYAYFSSKQQAADYAAGCEGSALIRETNLEDVYVKYTNKKVNR